MAESDPYMGATSVPPSADQPGHPGSIGTNDNRFLTASWQAGTLWTSLNDGCGSVVCARLVAVSTTASPPSVEFSQDLALAGGGDAYYPAVAIDQAGNITAAYTVSSTSTYPSVRVIGATLSGLTYTLLSGQTVKSGQNPYSDGTCLAAPPCRWGDYSGAAVDPNGKDMWLAGEWAASSAGVNNNWGTYVSRLTLSPPTVTSISPSSGASGTTVTISGSEFSTVAGATAVSFGAAAAGQVTCASTTSCTAVAPATTGTVDVTVTVNGQTSAASSGDLFSYGTVATPDFGVSASPASQTVTSGQSTTYTATVVSTGDYNDGRGGAGWLHADHQWHERVDQPHHHGATDSAAAAGLHGWRQHAFNQHWPKPDAQLHAHRDLCRGFLRDGHVERDGRAGGDDLQLQPDPGRTHGKRQRHLDADHLHVPVDTDRHLHADDHRHQRLNQSHHRHHADGHGQALTVEGCLL